MAKAVVRAVSVEQFHAMMIFSPSLAGAAGGAMRSGRPLSKSAVSSVVMAALEPPRTGRPTTMRSKTRPRLPIVASPWLVSSYQPNVGAA